MHFTMPTSRKTDRPRDDKQVIDRRHSPKSRPPAAKAKPARPDPVYAVELIDVQLIDPDPRNPRIEPAEAEIPLLAASLDQYELFAPIMVRPAAVPGRFIVIFGERRFRAAQQAGWRRIPAIVKHVDAKDAARLMVEENRHQRALNPIETARALELLVSTGQTQDQAAKVFNRSQAWAANLIRLLKLPPEWQRRIARGDVTPRQGTILIRYADKPDVLATAGNLLDLNPAEWDGTKRLEFQLVALAGNAKTRGPECDKPAAPTAETKPEPVSSPSAEVKPRPVSPGPPTSEEPGRLVRWIVELIHQLGTIEDCDVIALALDAHRLALSTPPA